MSTETVVDKPLGKLEHHPDNPRPKKAYSKEALKGLASAIDANGCDPLIVRELDGKLQVCAGNRRFEALELNGAKTAPVIIREMNDFEALRTVLANNGQHEAVDPFLEARGIAKLLKEDGATLESVAAGIGVSVRTVARRRELLNLAPSILEERLQADSAIALWPVSWLEALVQLEPAVQELWFKDERWAEFRTQDDVEGSVAEYLRDLSKAPWDLADATLFAKAGTCVACPKNGANVDGLFGAIKGPKAASGGTCRDAVCWKKKLERHVAQKVAQTIEKDPDVVCLKGPASYPVSGADKLERASTRAPKGHDVVESQGWKPCAKDDKGAKKGVVISGPSAGKTQWFKPQAQRSFDGYSPGPVKEPTAKEKLKSLEHDFEKVRGANFAQHVAERVRKMKDSPPHVDVMVLAAVCGLPASEWKGMVKDHAEAVLAAEAGVKEWAKFVWPSVSHEAAAMLGDHWRSTPAQLRDLARIVLGALVDMKDIAKVEAECDEAIKPSDELVAAREAVANLPKKGKKKKADAVPEDVTDSAGGDGGVELDELEIEEDDESGVLGDEPDFATP